ncbi:MAG: 5'-deoxynucleotidase [Clostridia bacterium]|nr:5'-deoxynucleotidase [Clostridia bacterium]
MANYNFYAMLSRMKYINRWGLMNNTREENIGEHSLDVAIFAHALVCIANKRFGENLNAERAALMGLFHDASEIITGDMPTPIKYFDPAIKEAYKNIEHLSEQKLLSMLPEDLRDDYAPLVDSQLGDEKLHRYVKAADKLSALCKCREELKMGNVEFLKAERSTLQALEQIDLPALKVFMEEFLPSFGLTLDELD